MTDTATSATVKQTSLHSIHRELGASFTDFAGWSMPVRYGSETAEHNAVRTAAGLFDLSHMGEIEVTGPEAGRALDRALVGRPSAISVGRARYTMICAEDGGILDDLVVYRLGEDEYLVVANASNVEAVAAALVDRTDGYDTRVYDASTEWSLLAVQGPRSAAVIADIVSFDVVSLKYYAITEARLGGHPVLIARTGYTGEDGFEIYCRPADAVSVWSMTAGAGRRHGLIPAGLACRDTLRLEAGMPLYGHELDASRTPFDAGLGRVVVFDKPDGFVGDEALEKRRHDVTQSLVGLVAEGRRSPRSGYDVIDPSREAVVGQVTSGSPSPTLGCSIAIAYLTTSLAAPGTAVEIDVRGTRIAAEVVELPFYRRNA